MAKWRVVAESNASRFSFLLLCVDDKRAAAAPSSSSSLLFLRAPGEQRETRETPMPSIFARARTTSTKNLPRLPLPPSSDGLPLGIDEFGRVSSRGAPPATPTKGGATTKGQQQQRRPHAATTGDRRRATGGAAAGAFPDVDEEDGGAPREDGFLPTSLVPPEAQETQYGYLAHEAHVVLGVEEVTRLVEVVSEEIGARGMWSLFF